MTISINTLFTKIGRDKIATTIGVTDKAVIAAVRRGIPASWFLPLRGLALKSGIDVDSNEFIDLFNWKTRAKAIPPEGESP